jgi:hypothetical protein
MPPEWPRCETYGASRQAVLGCRRLEDDRQGRATPIAVNVTNDAGGIEGSKVASAMGALSDADSRNDSDCGRKWRRARIVIAARRGSTVATLAAFGNPRSHRAIRDRHIESPPRRQGAPRPSEVVDVCAIARVVELHDQSLHVLAGGAGKVAWLRLGCSRSLERARSPVWFSHGRDPPHPITDKCNGRGALHRKIRALRGIGLPRGTDPGRGDPRCHAAHGDEPEPTLLE